MREAEGYIRHQDFDALRRFQDVHFDLVAPEYRKRLLTMAQIGGIRGYKAIAQMYREQVKRELILASLLVAFLLFAGCVVVGFLGYLLSDRPS